MSTEPTNSTCNMQHATCKICYVGAFDPAYSRNRIIRAGLEARGCQVSLATLPRDLNWRASLRGLWHTMRHEARDCDALIVAEFNQFLAPLAILLGRLLGKPVIIDYLVGLYESRVLDNNKAKRRAWRNTLYRALDSWTLNTAAGAFTDTNNHRAAFQRQVGRRAQRMAVVPVGVASEWLNPPAAPPKPPDAPLLVQFYGNFNPFHGVQVILRALSWLNTDERFRFEMIGSGPMHEAALKRAELLGIRRLAFIDPPTIETLLPRVQAADICLGVFARRDKTSYVVPHRVMEVMALGKPVVTAESAAIKEYFTPGEDLWTVPPSDPGELARALRLLAEDAATRKQLGENAARAIQQVYTPEEVVAPLLALLERVM